MVVASGGYKRVAARRSGSQSSSTTGPVNNYTPKFFQLRRIHWLAVVSSSLLFVCLVQQLKEACAVLLSGASVIHSFIHDDDDGSV